MGTLTGEAREGSGSAHEKYGPWMKENRGDVQRGSQHTLVVQQGALESLVGCSLAKSVGVLHFPKSEVFMLKH